MERIPDFSFLDVLCAFVCLDSRCKVVVRLENIKGHLQRKHHIKVERAGREANELLRAAQGKKPHAIAERYFSNPFPKDGESPLPVLPFLPVYDIVQCPCCSLFFNGVRSCRAHLRSIHALNSQFQAFFDKVPKLPTVKGQALFLGPDRLFFPVGHSIPSTEKCNSSSPPAILSSSTEERTLHSNSDELSVRDKSANLTCSILGIPEFLDSEKMTLQKAYEISCIDRKVHSKLTSRLLCYIQYFAGMQPPVPIAIVEGVKIRNGNNVANFSLTIEPKSKKRYASVASRVIQLAMKLDLHTFSTFQVDSRLTITAKQIVQTSFSQDTVPLELIHQFFVLLLLQNARASVGEALLLECLFKILIAGYTCGAQSERVRVGDADDASHSAAALQYFAHIAALGEFFAVPVGFGTETNEGERSRMARIRECLSTEISTPAAYIRIVLLKTKQLSAGECARVDFVTCPNHELCGFIDNIEIPLDSSQQGSLGFTVRKIRDDAMKLLRKELMKDFKLPTNFYETVLGFPDKLKEKEPGYYFGEGSEAKEKVSSWSEMFAKYLSTASNPILQLQLSDGKGQWGPTEHTSKWLRGVDELTHLLYALFHICGGGPPRVSEMIEAKVRNTAGGRRNLFIIKKRLAIIGSYSKTSRQSQKLKPIARFLDDTTSELFLTFILFIKPVQCFFLQRSVLEIRATQDYLFCEGGEQVTEDATCRKFSDTLSSRGLPLNVNLYRQYRSGAAKEFQAEKKPATNEALLFLQAGHTESTARKRYAGGEFTIGDMTLAKLEGFFEISTGWHKMIGIDRSSSVQAYFREQPKSNISHATSKSHALITNQAASQSNTCKELPITSGKSKPRSRLNMGDCEIHEKKRLKTTVATADASSGQAMEFSSLTSSLMQSARDILGISSQGAVNFKSDGQRAALFECAMQNYMRCYTSSMIVILPTGGGKTLTWAASALSEQRSSDIQGIPPPITLLIVPLISLQQDMERKCRNYGIRVGLWDERFSERITVVICSIDIVFTNDYKRFVAAFGARKRVSRIIIDEVHLVLLWEKLRRFRVLGERLRPSEARFIPLILLTATLPNHLIPKLEDVLQIDRSCVKLYRSVNTRPNISYQVQRISSPSCTDMLAHCSSLLMNEMDNIRADERIIAFCLTIKDCVKLYEILRAHGRDEAACLYHGSMSLSDKRASFETWSNKQSNVPIAMVATSAFSCGIDYPHVRMVLHAGGSRTILELAQESGRAGRDGTASKNIIVYNPTFFDNRTGEKTENGEPRLENDFGDVKLVLEGRDRCRREVIESFLNNAERGPCFGEEQKCDVCQSLTSDMPRNDKNSHSSVGSTSPYISMKSRERNGVCMVPNRKRVDPSDQVSYETKALSSTEEVFRYPANGSKLVDGSQSTLISTRIENAKWHTRQIALAKCAVCLFSGTKRERIADHAFCMRGRCFRCMERSSSHQSKDCHATPRGNKKTSRCFFCGIPRNKRLHDSNNFNRQGMCEWEVAKNLGLLMWGDPEYKRDMQQRIPRLQYCKTLTEVGVLLCGGERRDEEPLITNLVEYMYSKFVLVTGTSQ